MTKTGIRTAFLAVCALIVSLTATASPAAAYDFEYDVAVDATWQQAVNRDCNYRDFGLGSACFDEKGDVFYVTDNAADGRSIGIEWRTDYGRHGICRMKAGAKGTQDYVCDKNMIENTFYKYRAGVCDQTPTNDCQDPGDYDWAQPGALPWTDWLLNDH